MISRSICKNRALVYILTEFYEKKKNRKPLKTETYISMASCSVAIAEYSFSYYTRYNK